MMSDCTVPLSELRIIPEGGLQWMSEWRERERERRVEELHHPITLMNNTTYFIFGE